MCPACNDERVKGIVISCFMIANDYMVYITQNVEPGEYWPSEPYLLWPECEIWVEVQKPI
jgi:hypothetical protein